MGTDHQDGKKQPVVSGLFSESVFINHPIVPKLPTSVRHIVMSKSRLEPIRKRRLWYGPSTYSPSVELQPKLVGGRYLN